MTMDNVKSRLEVQATDQIEPQVQHYLRSYANDLLEEKLIDLVQEWFFKGFFFEEGMDVADVVSVKRRLEVQIIDKIEQQVQHLLRSYENDLLENKLIALVQEWFFKGFFGGTEHAQLKQKQKG